MGRILGENIHKASTNDWEVGTFSAYHLRRAGYSRLNMLEYIQIQQDDVAWAFLHLSSILVGQVQVKTNFEVRFINSKRLVTSRLSTTMCVNLGSARSTTFPPLSVIKFDNR